MAFKGTLDRTIDFVYLNYKDVYIDLGREVVSCAYALPSEQIGANSLPMTYLARTYCQKSFVRWATLGEGTKSVTANLYPTAILRDTYELTVEMSQLSRKRQKG
jgi:hypothetical protein